MERRHLALLGIAAFATLLLLESLRVFFSTIYFLNLSTLGINASVANAVLVLSPVLYALPWLRADPRRTLLGSVLLLVLVRLTLGVVWGSSTTLAVAGLAVAAGLVLLPALLRLGGAEDGAAAVAAGLALGLATDTALSVAGASRDLTVGIPGLLLAVPFAAALVALTWSARTATVPPEITPARGASRAGLAFGAWIFLEFAVLAAPYHVGRWNGAVLQSVALSSVLGLLIGAALVLLPLGPNARRGALLLGNAAILGFLLDHGFVHSDFVPALLLLAQAGMTLNAVALLSTLGALPLRTLGLRFLTGAAFLLVALFLFAFAYQFAFVPLGEWWEGRAPHMLLVAFALVALAALPRASLRRRLPNLRGDPALVAVLLLAPAVVAIAVPLALVPADVPDARAGGALRVVSFNVHQGFTNAGVVDPDVFVRVLRDLDADVVILQESDTPRFTSANVDVVAVVARTLGYHVHYGPATREQNVGLTLLSRAPILEATHTKLPSASDNRFVLTARILVNGTEIGVVGVHMGLPTADREVQIRAILEAARGLPAKRILVGDFNSCPETTCEGEDEPPDTVYATVTAEYVDAWVAAGNAATDPAGRTYEANAPRERIDYVFVRGITVVASEPVRTSDALRASDHLPVRADLRV